MSPVSGSPDMRPTGGDCQLSVDTEGQHGETLSFPLLARQKPHIWSFWRASVSASYLRVAERRIGTEVNGGLSELVFASSGHRGMAQLRSSSRPDRWTAKVTLHLSQEEQQSQKEKGRHAAPPRWPQLCASLFFVSCLSISTALTG